MFDRFSEPARRVVFWARIEAGRVGAETIEPEHILRGLLAEDQGDWVKVMASGFEEQPFGVAHRGPLPVPFFSGECAGKLRQVLANSASTGAAKADDVDMPLAERSQRAIESALEHAGRSTVGLLHILCALISDDENSVSHLLKTNGVSVEQVDNAIRNLQ